MGQSSNFWEILKDYEMEPPLHLDEQVFDSITAINPHLTTAIKESEIIPPLFLLSAIEKELDMVPATDKVYGSWMESISLLRRFSAAAAILMAIVTVVVFISISPKKQNLAEPLITVVPKVEKSVIPDSNKKKAYTQLPVAVTKKRTIHQKPGIAPPSSIASFSYIPEEGDLWVRFVSLNVNREEKDDWTNSTGRVKITIDEYSTLNISEQSMMLIRQIRETKKNGKPTRKANKTRKKLEKWKTKEEKYFASDRSPFDPIDLGNLLFNN